MMTVASLFVQLTERDMDATINSVQMLELIIEEQVGAQHAEHIPLVMAIHEERGVKRDSP